MPELFVSLGPHVVVAQTLYPYNEYRVGHISGRTEDSIRLKRERDFFLRCLSSLVIRSQPSPVCVEK